MRATMCMLFIISSLSTLAQDSLAKWTITPAVSLNPAGLTLGVGQFGLGALCTYQPKRKLIFSNYTNFQNVWFHSTKGFDANLNVHYNFKINHLYGIGTAFYGKSSINYLQFMMGLNLHRFKESVVNPNHELNYTHTSKTYAGFNYGFMWNSRKRISKGTQLSIRYYYPISNGFNLVDNLNQSALDVGLLFDLNYGNLVFD